MTETTFEIKNLKTTVLVKEIEISISIVSTLFTMTEKFSTKLSLKEVFA